MRRALLLALPLLLLGCAERWTRPGATEAETDAAVAACTAEAAAEHPPMTERRLRPPERIERERVCRTRNGREECTEREKPFADPWETVDLAAGRRAAARRLCLMSRGFRREGDRPLRL